MKEININEIATRISKVVRGGNDGVWPVIIISSKTFVPVRICINFNHEGEMEIKRSRIFRHRDIQLPLFQQKIFNHI